jgi:hypothetical protein
MLALIFVASCAVLVSNFALAQADKELPPNTVDCAAFTKTPNGMGMWDLELLSTLGHSRLSGLETIWSSRMIRMRVSAELTSTISWNANADRALDKASRRPPVKAMRTG